MGLWKGSGNHCERVGTEDGNGRGAKFGQSVSQCRGSESAERGVVAARLGAAVPLARKKKTLKKTKTRKTPRLDGLFAPAAPSISRGYFRPFLTVQFDSTRRSRRLRGLQGRARGDPGPTGARARARERRHDAMPRRLGSRGRVGPLARAEPGGKASRDLVGSRGISTEKMRDASRDSRSGERENRGDRSTRREGYLARTLVVGRSRGRARRPRSRRFVARAVSTFRHDEDDARERARCVVKNSPARAGDATTTGGRGREEG